MEVASKATQLVLFVVYYRRGKKERCYNSGIVQPVRDRPKTSWLE